MNIGLIGSGGREHALCQKIFESKFSKKIVCFPGNAGTSQIAKNIKIDILDFKEILKQIKFELAVSQNRASPCSYFTYSNHQKSRPFRDGFLFSSLTPIRNGSCLAFAAFAGVEAADAEQRLNRWV